MSIIKKLKAYTELHFSHEEEIMTDMGYSKLDIQKKTHAKFIQQLSEIDLEEMDEDQEGYLNRIITYLAGWLTKHILGMDKAIGEEAVACIPLPISGPSRGTGGWCAGIVSGWACMGRG